MKIEYKLYNKYKKLGANMQGPFQEVNMIKKDLCLKADGDTVLSNNAEQGCEDSLQTLPTGGVEFEPNTARKYFHMLTVNSCDYDYNIPLEAAFGAKVKVDGGGWNNESICKLKVYDIYIIRYKTVEV